MTFCTLYLFRHFQMSNEMKYLKQIISKTGKKNLNVIKKAKMLNLTKRGMKKIQNLFIIRKFNRENAKEMKY